MDSIGTRIENALDFVSKTRKISGQNGGSYEVLHELEMLGNNLSERTHLLNVLPNIEFVL